MRARKGERIGGDARDEGVHGLAELLPETSAPCLVPLAHLNRLVFGWRPEDDSKRHTQPMSLERTVDQGMLDAGF